MTTSHENPFGTGYSHTSPAARNMMKLGLSGPIFQPPPGDTYLFRTASLEKEWQDAFRQATDTPSAQTPDNPPASVPSGWARQSTPASGTPSGLLPNTFNSVSESGLRFPVIDEKALETLGKILLPDPARDPAPRPLPPAFPADTRKTAAVPETSPAKTGFIPAGKPRPIPVPGDPDYNPDNPLCEPMAVRPIEQGKNAPIPPVSPEQTVNLNTRHTRENQCRPIGINHTQVSLWEGDMRKQAYVPWSEHQKDNRSGITVGAGLDLGQRDENGLKQLGLPEELFRKLVPYVKHQQGKAVSYLKEHPLSLSTDEIDTINLAAMYDMGTKVRKTWDTLVTRNRDRYPNAPYFHELTSDQQTWLFSRFYQNGAFTRRERTKEARKKAELARGENFRGHPDFFRAVMKNDWDTATRQMKEQAKKLRKNRATKWQGNRLQKEIKWYKNNR